MTVYTIAWGVDDDDPSGQRTIQVESPDEADAALDQVAAEGPALVVVHEGLWAEGDPPPPLGMQIVWGHPERALLTWLGPGAGRAVDENIPPWPEPIGYDQGEAMPDRTRITAGQVREAVREYVRTGSRPANVTWVST